MPCTITAAEHPSPPSFIMQTRCSARLPRCRSSQPSAGLGIAAAPGNPSGSSERLVPQRGPPARVSPPWGVLRPGDRTCSPQGLTTNPPPRRGVRGAAGQQAASSESGAGRCVRSAPRLASPCPAGGERRGHRAGAAPWPAAGSSPSRGQDGGLRCPLPLSAWRQLRRGGCEGTNPPRGRCGQPRLTAGASGGAERSPLPGARHNPQKVATRRKSRILPEPRPPGWRAVAKGHQKERDSGGAAHLCRFLAASAAEKRPGSGRRNPPGSRPAQPRAALQPRRS